MADDPVTRAERLRRLRREPPAFRPVEVRSTDDVTPRLRRVVLGGERLDGFSIDEPAASVRVLLPPADAAELVLPEWDGNEFLLADGTRPIIRTLTPRAFDGRRRELVVDVVNHGRGAAAAWAAAAEPGSPAAVSGPGRGYRVDGGAPGYLLAGDETAIPAISQLLERLPDVPVQVLIEVADDDARHELPPHPQASIAWFELPSGAAPGELLVPAVEAAGVAGDTRVWVAGEAAAVQRIRTHLFGERNLPRAQATVRGYWKRGRAASSDATPS